MRTTIACWALCASLPVLGQESKSSHHLNDSEARTLMLRKSEAFLRQGFGM
jgi:hypothetical protein